MQPKTHQEISVLLPSQLISFHIISCIIKEDSFSWMKFTDTKNDCFFPRYLLEKTDLRADGASLNNLYKNKAVVNDSKKRQFPCKVVNKKYICKISHREERDRVLLPASELPSFEYCI